MIKKFRPVYTTEATVFAAALLITLPLRTIQYFTNVEHGTGFYGKFDANVIIYGAVLALASLYFIISTLIKKKSVSLETKPVRLPACGVFAFLSAFGAAYCAYTDYKMKDIDFSEFTVSSTATNSINGNLAKIQLVLGLLAALFFVLLAISFLTGTSGSYYKLLSLSVPLWYVLRLVVRFTRTISYLRVSDLALEMISFVFLAWFFMAFAQTNSAVDTKENEWKLGGFGFPGALFALNLFIPRLVLVVSGKTSIMYIMSRLDFADITVALFIIATLLTRIVPNISNVTVKGADDADNAQIDDNAGEGEAE